MGCPIISQSGTEASLTSHGIWNIPHHPKWPPLKSLPSMSHWLGFKKVTMTPACPPLTPVPPCSALRRWRVLLSSGSPAPWPAVFLLHPLCSHRSASHCHSPTIPGYPEMAEPTEHLPRPKQCKKISSSEDRLETQNNQLFQSGHSSLTLQPAASE